MKKIVDILLRGWDGERRLSRCLPNTSTFVPNDRSQCLCCVLPIMLCAFGAHLDVGLAERSTPCRFIELETGTFPSLISGKMAVFDHTEFLKCHTGTAKTMTILIVDKRFRKVSTSASIVTL